MNGEPTAPPLAGVRVLEVADETGEFAGKLLAGLGADVVKVEPPAGEATRGIGPFYADVVHPDRSLHFWHYNLGKRGVTLDLEVAEAREVLRQLLGQTDVLLLARDAPYLDAAGLGEDAALQADYPALVIARVTPFGRSGPYRDYRANDLIHLALGGHMALCGYDPVETPEGLRYDTPPIAPQMNQSYHIAGCYTAIGVLTALLCCQEGGAGQVVDISVHEAVTSATENALPFYIYTGIDFLRQTGRNALQRILPPVQFPAADGKLVTSFGLALGDFNAFLEILRADGLEGELADPAFQEIAYRARPEAQAAMARAVQRFLAAHPAEEAFHLAQRASLVWSPIRTPEEGIADPHLRARGAFAEIPHPELGRAFTYVGLPWLSDQLPWQLGPRAPLLGEHNAEVYGALGLDVEALAARGVI